MITLESLLSGPRPLVKICGLREPEQVRWAADTGASMIGLVFAPSRRQVAPPAAAALAAERDASLAAVGVFVNEQPTTMNAIARDCRLDFIQLSGDEPADMLDQLSYPAIVALRLTGDEREAAWIERAKAEPQRVLLLVDAHVAGSYGGAGVLANWDRAAALARELPILLAGGLEPTNVAAAVAAVRPLGLDVSSGVETDGVKDRRKIQHFIQAARNIHAAIDQSAL